MISLELYFSLVKGESTLFIMVSLVRLSEYQMLQDRSKNNTTQTLMLWGGIKTSPLVNMLSVSGIKWVRYFMIVPLSFASIQKNLISSVEPISAVRPMLISPLYPLR